MKKTNLNIEEKNILLKFENDELENIPNMEEKIKEFQMIAKNQLKKDANINIRLSSGDLRVIKEKAGDSGMPYQTLISTLIHHFVTGKIRISL